VNDKHWQLLKQLQQASTDEERAWLILQFNLNSLPTAVQNAVWRAVVPDWFNRHSLAELLETELTDDEWEKLIILSYVEIYPQRGWNIHEATRDLLLHRLAQDKPDQLHRWQICVNQQSEIPFLPAGITLNKLHYTVWQALSSSIQKQLTYVAEAQNNQQWRQIWEDLYFNPPSLPNTTPAQMRIYLNEIRSQIEAIFTGLQKRTRPTSPETVAEAPEQAEQSPARVAKINSLEAQQHAERGIAGIVKQLQKGRLKQAQRYLHQLLQQQQQKWAAKAQHLAKTLSNVAGHALQQGYIEWADELYQQAITLSPSDVVARTGLAEVLKARGALDEAEQAYREVIQRWPENVVARNGLAEVLKARGALDEAEQAYREVIQRWPSDVVARNGLANFFRQQKRYQEALALLPNPSRLQTLQDHRDRIMHCIILLNMEQLDRVRALLETGLTTAPTQQVPYYRHWLLMVQIKADRLETQLELAPDAGLAEKVIHLHIYAKCRQLGAAKHLAQELNQQEPQMSRQMRKTFNLVETTFCRLDRNEKCEPEQAELDYLYESEQEMLIEAQGVLQLAA